MDPVHLRLPGAWDLLPPRSRPQRSRLRSAGCPGSVAPEPGQSPSIASARCGRGVRPEPRCGDGAGLPPIQVPEQRRRPPEHARRVSRCRRCDPAARAEGRGRQSGVAARARRGRQRSSVVDRGRRDVNAQVFADWLRQQGHRIIRTENASWYDAGPRVFQAFPYHQVIRPPEEELAAFLRRQGAIALRYSTPLDAPVGRVSYHVVCENRAYDMPALERRARQGVRHGLERCRVEAIPLDRLAREGWQLEAETCQRQGREVPSSEEAWRRRCRVAASLPGFEAWGALVDGRLVASLLAVQIDDCYELLTQQCLTPFL